MHSASETKAVFVGSQRPPPQSPSSFPWIGTLAFPTVMRRGITLPLLLLASPPVSLSSPPQRSGGISTVCAPASDACRGSIYGGGGGEGASDPSEGQFPEDGRLFLFKWCNRSQVAPGLGQHPNNSRSYISHNAANSTVSSDCGSSVLSTAVV